MRIGKLTYQQVGEDLLLPDLCRSCDRFSQNEHYRGIRDDRAVIHWSRGQIRKSGLHAFMRAVLDVHSANDWHSLYVASVEADRRILEVYGIRIPASASKWERRRVLALAIRDKGNLRTYFPNIYAWAHYGDIK